MRVLVIRHVPFEDVGLLGRTLAEQGVEIVYEDSKTSNGSGASALILMGGPMSANDAEPWVSRELHLIENAMRDGIPILGICLGAQLIAKALGAPVFPNPVKEIGWYPIDFKPAAAGDPLFRGLDRPETVFHWHGETFGLPAGAAWLAASERCAHQAFRYGSNIYGLQFHLEVTPLMIADWCGQDANCGDVRELDEAIDPELHAERQGELAGLIFGRWADCFLR